MVVIRNKKKYFLIFYLSTILFPNIHKWFLHTLRNDKTAFGFHEGGGAENSTQGFEKFHPGFRKSARTQIGFIHINPLK